MKEPKRLLSHGATDFERQLLRAVAAERPSALLRSRMQRSLGLVGPLAWASNVKAMVGDVSSRLVGSRAAAGAAVAGVVAAGGVAAYLLVPSPRTAEAPLAPAPSAVVVPAPVAEPAAPVVVPAAAREVEPAPEPAAPLVDEASVEAEASDDGRLREEIALLDGVKAALQRGERERARQGLEAYRERFPDGVLRREANVLRRRAAAGAGRSSASE